MIGALALLTATAAQPADTLLPAAPPMAQPYVVVLIPPPADHPPLVAPPAPPPPPPEIPGDVKKVIDAAIASGDPAAVSAVVRFTKQTNPDVAPLIDAVDADYRRSLADAKARADRERIARIEAANALQLWTGSIEAGASQASGNNSSLGLYGALTGERKGIDWTHKLAARIDYQRTTGLTTAERILLSWQPNYRLGDRAYAFGVASYEHDQLLGYASRYTAAAGFGYGLVRSDRLRVDFEGGPALRHTELIDRPANDAIAGRASLNLAWKLGPSLQLAQASALYYEPGATSATATTSLDTKLIGALKARFSYDVKYERNAPAGADPVDTLSRATLVYSF